MTYCCREIYSKTYFVSEKLTDEEIYSRIYFAFVMWNGRSRRETYSRIGFASVM